MQPPAGSSLPMESLLAQAGWVRELARRIVRDPDLADDLAQDVCLAALRHRPDDRRPLRAWLATVLRNRVRQDVRSGDRRTHREQASARAEASASTLELVERLSVHRALVEEVAKLDEPYQEVILLRYFEELTPAQIATRLVMPLSTVKTRLARGLERLRGRLAHTRREDGQSWLSALVLFTQTNGSQPATPVLGALFVSTQLKLLIIGLFVTAGLVYVWPAGAPNELVAPQLADAQDATATPELEEATTLVDEVASSTERAGVVAAPAVTEETAPATPDAIVDSTTLRGLVRSSDGKPLAGVPVRFDPDDEADERIESSVGDGSVVFDHVESGGALESADPERTTVFAGQVSVNRRDAEPVLVVAERRALAGRVVDAEGFALAGASIEVHMPVGFRARFNEVMDFSSARDFKTESDADGFFALPNAPGVDQARLRVQLTNYSTYDEVIPPVADTNLLVTLTKPTVIDGALVGRVVDRSGRGVAEANVSFGVHGALTDEDGSFAFDLTDASSPNRMLRRYMGREPDRILAVKAGFQPAERRLALDEESGLPLDVEAIVLQLGDPPLAVSGRVVDENGAPLSDVTVWIEDSTLLSFGRGGLQVLESVMSGADSPWLRTTTNANGAFELGGLSARDYRIKAMDAETLLTVVTDPVPAGSTGLRVVLDQTGLWKRVAGRVVNSAGEPVEGVTIAPQTDSFQVRLDGRPVSTMHSRVSGTVTDEDGRFEVERVPKDLVYLRLDGEEIISTEYGRHVEGGLGELAQGKLENLTIQVPVRVHFRVALADPAMADALRVLDEAGETITINVIEGNNRRELPVVTIVDGETDSLTVHDGARTIVLLKGETEVQRLPVTFAVGELNRIEL